MEIDLRSCGQRRQHGLSVPVVHDHLIGVLHQTGCLRFARLVKTFLIDLNFQTAREKHGALMKRFGIVGWNLADFIQKFLYPQSALACEIQVLSSAHKCSRLSLYCRAQGAEVARCLRGQKEKSLLCVLRHRDNDALFTYLPRPSFSFCKPLVWGRICRTLKKCNRQHVMHGLIVRKRRVHPKPITGLQIRHFGNRQSFASSRYVYLYPWPGKIKRSIGECKTAGDKKKAEYQAMNSRRQNRTPIANTQPRLMLTDNYYFTCQRLRSDRPAALVDR